MRRAALAVVTLLVVVWASRAQAQTGLVAAYGFNEGAGTIASDASGNANTGTLNGATWNAAGRFGSAVVFNGTSNWVTVPHSAVLNLTSGLTIEAWVYASSLGRWESVLLKESIGGLSYGLYASDTSSHPSAYIRRTSDIDVTGPSSLAANTWVHLAATYNGSSMILYVNGTQVATKAITGAIVTSSQPLRIGGNSVWGEYFSGRIDEVRIYNRALAASEIQSDMNTPIAPAVPPAPDFSFASTPGAATVVQGGSASYALTVGGLNGFTGTVSLSVAGLPANATATFTPATVSGAGSATLNVFTTAATSLGTSTLAITGTSGALSHTTTATLGVSAAPVPDFSLSATPASRTIVQGGATSYTLTLAALNGFAGTVGLSLGGLPANASASFSPASVTGSGSTTLNVTTAANTPTGTSTLTITGTSGALTRTTSVSLGVTPPPDFTISATPGSRTVVVGSAATFSVAVGGLNGFSGTVGLSATGMPANASASFSPANVGSGGSSTLTVTTAATTPIGTSTIGIVGTSGTLSHSATVNLVASAAGVGRAIGINFVGTGTAMGATESAGVVPKARWNNATGASQATALALLDETGAVSGSTVTWSASSTSRTSITDQAGNRRMMRGYLDTTNTSSTTVTVAGLPTAAYDIYVYADGNNGTSARTGAYRISGTGITTTTINLIDAANASFSGTFTQATNSNGNYVKFSVVASGFTVTATPVGSSSTRRAPLNGIQIIPVGPPPPPPPAPDFGVSVTPGTRSVVQGSGTSYTVTTTALNGFAGTVNLAIAGLPASATAVFTPSSIAGPGTAVLDVSTAPNTPTGTSLLTITGTGGPLTHSSSVTLGVTGLTYSVSGVVTPGADGAATAVSLQGTAVAATTTDGSGAFGFAGVPNGTYLVTPAKPGSQFAPTSRNFSVSGANVTDVDFQVTVSPNWVFISAPANGATVPSAFSMSATASASMIGVQFQVDGVSVGAEDTNAPYSTSVTVTGGGHVLTAIGRDANGNTVTSAPVDVTASGSTGTALTINGATTFQTMDGMGVNINSLSWKNGELAPALDRLINDVGVKTWRVVFDMTDWESTNDDSDPNSPNWAYYNALYETEPFQNLWGTLGYLNQKGITSGIVLSFMGQVPAWMGGAAIQTNLGNEDEFVEMLATLYSYAKNTKGLQFDMIDPMNEPDWDGFEGPQVAAAQYVGLLQKLSVKLDAMGLGSLRFVGPGTASVTAGVDTYITQLIANNAVMDKFDHFGLHNYAGQTGGADAKVKQSAPTKNFWMTELSIPEEIFTMISQGAAGAQIWDAYDSVYNHAVLAGAFYHDGRGTTPPNDAGNLPALMAYDASTGVYTARPQFYQMATFRYVTPGSVRISATESNVNLTTYAFLHPTTGKVTIIGRNVGSSPITLLGSLTNAAGVGALALFQTSISDNFNSFTRGSDVVVTGGSFVVMVPANSFFTLTSSAP